MAAWLLAFAATASAGPVGDRVRSNGAIRCGAVARPGLLEIDREGRASGLLVELCRAIGVAANVPAVKAQISEYESDASFDAVRNGRDDVFFLSGAEIVDQKLANTVLPGPAAFHETLGLLIDGQSPILRLTDLASQPICFLQGDASHRAIEAFFAAHGLSLFRMGYQEVDEMHDAFDARRCVAMAGEITALAAARLAGDRALRDGRILDDPLATFPILLATSPSDGEWSALAAWTLATLLVADRPRRDWDPGGLDRLPIDLAPFGISSGWQRTVLAAIGTYDQIYRRTLGDGSPLGLPLGPNALSVEGGLMAPPQAR
jgi:general L-amino acid transport system substrate-binding protein